MKDYGLIIKLLLSIVLIMLFGDSIPDPIQRGFFTLSILLKDTLVFTMPLIVFSFIFASLSSFQRSAPLLIVLILSLVLISNFTLTQIGFLTGETFLSQLGYHAENALTPASTASVSLEPYFSVPYPKLISTDLALLIGTVLGLIGAFWGNAFLANCGDKLKNIVQAGLTKVFIPLVPLYVIGFLFKIQHEESLTDLFAGYGPMIGLIVLTQFTVILFFYFKANFGNMKNFMTSLKNVCPSGIVALSTMSSAATMPLTLEAAEKNTKNKSLTQVVIPATTNIHHVGDSIAIPILIAVVLAMHGIDSMNYSTFLLFSMYYMVAKFGVPSVPGGELIVLFPILDTSFGFTASMSGLLTTLYLLMDPFITVTNVLCNGALSIFVDKIAGRMKVFSEVEVAA